MDILVVDDDRSTRKMVRFILEQEEGHSIAEAETPEEAESRVKADRFDLVMMDVMMPGLDGFELCKRVRTTSNVPIMILSARGDVQSRVRGLQLGADDYLPKPFDPSELLARIDAIFRRTSRFARATPDGTLRVGTFTLHLGEHEVELRRPRGGTRKVQLTPTEFKLLLVFAREPGRAFTRDELLSALWGPGVVDLEASYSTLNAYVSGLREKLEEDPRHPRHLLTVRGTGYKLAF